jgi:hypothetical protein
MRSYTDEEEVSQPIPQQPTTPSQDVTTLQQQVTTLTAQVAAAQAQAKAALDRANYIKSIYEPVWARLEALKQRPVGISRDEAWQIAADRAFVEVTTEGTGIRSAIKALVQPAQPADLKALTQKVDTIAQNANGAIQLLSEKVAAKASRHDALTIAKQAITDWLAASIAYTDSRLLNLIWDRGVKLLCSKERASKTAEQLPINDPKNLEV